ncbi:hypothetical protein LguiA_030124 [Lonicera macranthoides]
MKGVSLKNHIIHIQELVSKEGHVSASAFAFASEIPSSPIICRVPNNMREVDPQAYEPNAVSIGPFYYGDEKLLPIQLQHKLRFCSRLTDRSHTAIDLRRLKESVDKLVPHARRCYYHNFDEIPDSEFSLMMVLDGCFILELFRCDHKLKKGNVIDDPILDTRWIMTEVRRDLTKMGNQLPFFVLEELFNLTKSSTDDQEPSLLEYAISFFAPLLPASAFDVIVTELGRYGIKIVKGNGHLLDIKYTDTLKVPPLLLDYGTVHVFQNLVAYEQCGGRSTPSYFTTYVMLLSELMKSSKDVYKLYEQRIIKHTLVNDKEAIAMLRSLCKQIAFDGVNCYLQVPIQNIVLHKNRRLFRFRAALSYIWGDKNRNIAILALQLSILGFIPFLK